MKGFYLATKLSAGSPSPGAMTMPFAPGRGHRGRRKHSKPYGEIGQDAFGNVPYFEDRDPKARPPAVGRQDVDPGGSSPVTGYGDPGRLIRPPHLRRRGAASPVRVGDILRVQTHLQRPPPGQHLALRDQECCLTHHRDRDLAGPAVLMLAFQGLTPVLLSKGMAWGLRACWPTISRSWQTATPARKKRLLPHYLYQGLLWR